MRSMDSSPSFFRFAEADGVQANPMLQVFSETPQSTSVDLEARRAVEHHARDEEFHCLAIKSPRGGRTGTTAAPTSVERPRDAFRR